jgi:hypothetical protein
MRTARNCGYLTVGLRRSSGTGGFLVSQRLVTFVHHGRTSVTIFIPGMPPSDCRHSNEVSQVEGSHLYQFSRGKKTHLAKSRLTIFRGHPFPLACSRSKVDLSACLSRLSRPVPVVRAARSRMGAVNYTVGPFVRVPGRIVEPTGWLT